MAALLHQVRLRSVLPQPLRSRRNVLILVPICFYRDGYSCQESGSALLKKRHLVEILLALCQGFVRISEDGLRAAYIGTKQAV